MEKFTRIALLPMKTSTKTMRMQKFVKKPFVLSQKVAPKHGFYLAQVKSEKLIADMRGYDSVFDYLLAEQEVDRAMFDRQIDLIMKNFARSLKNSSNTWPRSTALKK